MDIQPIFDYFSVIAYVTDYGAKAEKQTSEILKAVKQTKERENVSTRDVMYALAQAYLTGREIGECEAYYKLEPSLHYKQSNIKTVFISSGFPQNRSRFLRKCKPDEEFHKNAFNVDKHEGKFTLPEICLTQFTLRYNDVSPETKKKILESDRIPTSPTAEQGYKGTLTIVTDEEEDTLDLQDFIELQNGRVMTLRRFDTVIRRHKFDFRKDPHEYFYSELLLFYPWIDECNLFPNDFEK